MKQFEAMTSGGLPGIEKEADRRPARLCTSICFSAPDRIYDTLLNTYGRAVMPLHHFLLLLYAAKERDDISPIVTGTTRPSTPFQRITAAMRAISENMI